MFNKPKTISPEQKPVVSCQKCSCLVYKAEALVVKSNWGDNYYCREHKPPYDEVSCSYRGSVKYYRHCVACDEKGKIIKK